MVWNWLRKALGSLPWVDQVTQSPSWIRSREAEFGDLLFSIVNAARLYGVNPDTALEHTNAKFMRRFSHIEATAAAQGRSVTDMSLDEMEAAWQDAKSRE